VQSPGDGGSCGHWSASWRAACRSRSGAGAYLQIPVDPASRSRDQDVPLLLGEDWLATERYHRSVVIPDARPRSADGRRWSGRGNTYRGGRLGSDPSMTALACDALPQPVCKVPQG
jgi:hypothetical protein